MNNIQAYDEFLNEGFIGNIKSKVSGWWNNFQNKETVMRKVHMYINGGAWPLLFIYFCSLIVMYIPGFMDDSIKQILKSNRSLMYLFLVTFYILSQIDRKLMLKVRPKLIQNKMKELREQFIDKKYNDFYSAIIGNKKNIKAVLKRLKDDGVITDANILELPDVTVIDFSGTHNLNFDQHTDVDPYGEEEWADTEVDNIESRRARLAASQLEDIYKVKFRIVKDVIDYVDKNNVGNSFLIKTFGTKPNDKLYKHNLEEIRLRRMEKEMNQQEDVPDDNQDDDIQNWDDDRDYFYYNRPVKEPKPRKFKKFKANFRDKFKNFVVPGFNIESPKTMDRE